jgi:uncharacterized protein (TIGR03663 family)
LCRSATDRLLEKSVCAIIRAMKSRGLFFFLSILILLAAVGLRFALLDLKAVHHDESVNYSFTKKLVDRNHYHYNPNHYHGPFLYYAAVPAWLIAGASKAALRFAPALFGVLAVLFFLLMQKTIGRPGALFGAAMIAISPADIYFSRTFIHEIYLAALAAGFLWAFLEFTRKAKWKYVFAFFIFAAFSFTIKETTAIMGVALVAAYFGTRLYFLGWSDDVPLDDRMKMDWKFLRGHWIYLADAIALFFTILILFFSSFLTYPQGLLKFFEAYMPWMKTGFKDSGHVKPAFYFFIVTAKYYAPIVVPALLTGLWSISKKKPRGVFLFLYGMFLLIFYSAIPYKTPWCVLQIAIPFVALAGYGLSKALAGSVPRLVRIHVLLFMAVLFVPTIYTSVRINFYDYDDDSIKIVYVQTDRTFEDMFALLDQMAKRSGRGKNIPIALIDAKNPARVYLRNYKKVKKYEDVPEKIIKAPVVLVKSTHLKKMEAVMPGPYVTLTYPVWPGTFVAMLVDKSFYAKYAKGETES